MDAVCRYCGATVTEESYFCNTCGKKLKDKPPSTSVGRQIVVYAVSMFLPPLGLWPAIKYLRQHDEKSKYIGIAALTITVLSIIITLWLTFDFVRSVNETINSLDISNVNTFGL